MLLAMQFTCDTPRENCSSSLIGNKVYFIFENILICIGNKIFCDDDYSVETIIENRKINKKFYFGDKEVIEKNAM